jgi:hypothetical protein
LVVVRFVVGFLLITLMGIAATIEVEIAYILKS